MKQLGDRGEAPQRPSLAAREQYSCTQLIGTLVALGLLLAPLLAPQIACGRREKEYVYSKTLRPD